MKATQISWKTGNQLTKEFRLVALIFPNTAEKVIFVDMPGKGSSEAHAVIKKLWIEVKRNNNM